jgi:hypothetical protein
LTALSIVQQVCAWQALPIPQALFSATDAQTVELRGLLNEEIGELKKWPDCYWRKLIRQQTFISEASDVQTLDPLPDDLEYIIPNTMWDRTMTRPCLGPIDPATWQAWKARPILTSVLWGWRLRGNEFLTAPNPPAGDTVAYEYISNLAVYADGDVTPTKAYFTADTDTSIFDEIMVARGVRWRFLSQKKLDYAQEYAVWVGLVQREASRNKGMPILSAAGPSFPGLAGPYVPSFNFPGS